MKKITALFIGVILFLTPLSGFSAEKETLETLKSKAVDASVELVLLDSGLETIKENLRQILDAREQLQELSDAYAQYEELYNMGAHLIPDYDPLNPDSPTNPTPEQIELKNAYLVLQNTFQTLYGITAPTLTEDQKYINFIKPIEVIPLRLESQRDALRIDRQRTVASIGNGVETLWWNLGSLRVQMNVTDAYLNLVKVQLDAQELRLKLGLSSVIELDSKKLEFETASTNLRRINREIENLEYRLRNLAGLNFNEAFSAVITAEPSTSEALFPYDAYMRLALRTRVDAIKALRAIDVVKQEEEIIEDYISASSSLERKEVAIRLLEAEQNYAKLINSLDSEIYEVYDGAMSAKENLNTMELRYNLALAERARSEAFFNQGYLSSVDFEGAKLMLIQAEINLENSKYQYNLKLQELYHTVTYGGSMGGLSL